MTKSKLTPDEQLADDLARFYDDALGYVMYVFPWNTERSIQQVKLQEPYKSRFNCEYGPDVWACEFLDDLSSEVKARGFNGRDAVDPIQFATASGHGIGKSVLVGWIIKWILDTRPYAKGIVTAGTADQLKTKTWAEVGKWHRISLTEHWFRYNTGRGAMSLSHKKYPEIWRCDAMTCKEENSDSFAGLHAANSTPFYIFDEASAVPDKIYEVRQGGTTDGEPMVFDFGNPTQNTGYFFENCEGKFKHRYNVRSIDSRTVQITNKKLFQRWIDDYGIDSDYVKVRVLGRFPSAGAIQFIGLDDVRAAQQRRTPGNNSTTMAPLVIGVDVARFGDDDSVIYPRIGDDARSFAPTGGRGCYKKLDTLQLTGKIIETVRRFEKLGKKTHTIFVDGGNVGGAIVDNLRHLGYPVIEVQFGSRPIDSDTYRYTSDNIWGNMKKAIETSLVLPDARHPSGNELFNDLTQRQFGYTLNGQKIHLETKADMKSRGVPSPDIGDALALTYYMDIAPDDMPLGGQAGGGTVISEYDVLEEAHNDS